MAAKILVIPPIIEPSKGVWYPKKQQKINYPDSLPKSVRISQIFRHKDPQGDNWKQWKNGVSLPELNVNDQRYVKYRTTFKLTASDAKKMSFLLINSFSRDIITAKVNGKIPKRLAPDAKYADKAGRNLTTSHIRITQNDFDNQFDITTLLKEGQNSIELLYENIGYEHGYVPMEELSGISFAGISTQKKKIDKVLEWEIALNSGGIDSGWLKNDIDTSKWEKNSLETKTELPHEGNEIQPKKTKQNDLMTWYRMEFQLPKTNPKDSITWMLRILASGNGYIYLNGHNIGKHYETGPQRDWYLPECWLKTGTDATNTILLELRQTSHNAIIKGAEIRPYNDSTQ